MNKAKSIEELQAEKEVLRVEREALLSQAFEKFQAMQRIGRAIDAMVMSEA